jgi:hypothetical protein
MGRSKQSRPVKRQRIIQSGNDDTDGEVQNSTHEQQRKQIEEQEGLAMAIELLRKNPPDQVEAAAAEATRLDLTRNDRWIHLLPPPPSSTTTTAVAIFDDTETSRSNGDNKVTTSSPKSSSDTAASIDFSTCSVYTSKIPFWLRGLGLARLSSNDFLALQELHRLIKHNVSSNTSSSSSSSSSKQWASWSGSVDDPRKRAFGFLPGTLGYDPQIRNNRLDITMPTVSSQSQPPQPQSDNKNDEEIRDKERAQNKRAMVVLDKSELPNGAVEAIHSICRVFREHLLSKNNDCNNDSGGDEKHDDDYRRKIAEFLRYENLIAAQPNLHSGRALLPIHLDDPRKDGFGVVIITIGMKDAGEILFRDSKALYRGVAMRLKAGEAYMLADRARDACSHGVLADYSPEIDSSSREEESQAKIRDANTNTPFSVRESLNLRFGLHDLAPNESDSSNDRNDDKSTEPLNVIPASMVFRHWNE